MTTPYQMAISNVAWFIRGKENRGSLHADTAARVLSIAFCKDFYEVLEDILDVEVSAIILPVG